jgi:hypothetical protein
MVRNMPDRQGISLSPISVLSRFYASLSVLSFDSYVCIDYNVLGCVID